MPESWIARHPRFLALSRGLLLLTASLLAGCRTDEEAVVEVTASPAVVEPRLEPEERLEVPPPPFSPGIYPCSMCHGMMPANPARRTLAFHTEIVLKHDEEHRWCLDCHNAGDRDWLHLASGELVPFEESYRLCGQCHGEKYRDWRAGIHGRRSGKWNGHKTYLLCAHCHDPHQPHFKPIEPMPAPIPPAETVGGSDR
jgi:hypothetical protein